MAPPREIETVPGQRPPPTMSPHMQQDVLYAVHEEPGELSSPDISLQPEQFYRDRFYVQFPITEPGQAFEPQGQEERRYSNHRQ